MQLFQIIPYYVLFIGTFFKCLPGQKFNRRPTNFRVIYGHNIDIRKAPWQVSLDYNTKWWNFIFNCGGVIIGRREVLTAAHCFLLNRNPSFYRIRAGSSSKLRGGTLHYLQTVKIHPEHDYTTCRSERDLAFVRVREAFHYNEFTRPIPLSKSDPKDGEIVMVAGWGISAPETQSHPEYLQAVNFTAWHKDKCLPEDSPLEDDMFCLRSLKIGGREFLCTGDSGGPVVKNNELVGIISGVAPKVSKSSDEDVEALPCKPITREDVASMLPILGDICNPRYGVSVYNSIVPHRTWIKIMMRQKISGG